MAGFFEKLKKGLEKTRNSFTDRINEVFQVAVYIDDDMYDELEEALITSDVGARTADEIIERLESKYDREFPSREIGELVMRMLMELDQVAYVRFASVYRRFEDVDQFVHEVKGMHEPFNKLREPQKDETDADIEQGQDHSDNG